MNSLRARVAFKADAPVVTLRRIRFERKDLLATGVGVALGVALGGAFVGMAFLVSISSFACLQIQAYPGTPVLVSCCCSVTKI